MIGSVLLGLLAVQDLNAGAAVVDITPEKWPVVVNGSFTERSAGQARDRLSVRALALDDGATRVAWAVVDSCMVPRDLLDAAKARAGLPADRVLISATHTHSAPSAMGCLGSDADPDYPAFLVPRIAQSIKEAVAALRPAELGWAVVRAPDHTFTRRWILRSDKVRRDPFGDLTVRANMHPGYQNADFVGPSGPTDPDLTILAVRTLDGRPLALFANFSMHYFGAPAVSADYFGVFAREIGAAIGAPEGFVAAMSQGTSGDQMWMDYGGPKKNTPMAEYARGLVSLAADAWKDVAFKRQAPIAMKEELHRVRRRVPDDKRLAWAKEVAAMDGSRKVQSQPQIYAREAVLLHQTPEVELKIQALRIGEGGIAAMPNEVFAISGLKVKSASPLRPTMVVTLANGAEGYIPPPEQHALGGYTTWPARTAGLEVQAEPHIVETAVRLLEAVAGKPRLPFAEPDSPYAKAVLASKPVAYWRLGELSGPCLHDASGNGRHAELEGAVALHLDGPPLRGSSGPNRCVQLAGGRLRVPDLPLGDAWSVTLWFQDALPAESDAPRGWILRRAVADGPPAEGLGLRPAKDHAVGFMKRWPGSTAEGGAGAARRPRAWVHLAVAFDAGAMSVYADGHRVVHLDSRTPPLGPVRLGGLDGEPAFEGRLDEIVIYDRALGAEEIGAQLQAAR